MQISPILNMLLTSGSAAGSTPLSLLGAGMEAGAEGFNSILGISSASTKALKPSVEDSLLTNDPQGGATIPLASIALPDSQISNDQLDLSALESFPLIKGKAPVAIANEVDNDAANFSLTGAAVKSADADNQNTNTDVGTDENKIPGQFVLKEVPIVNQNPNSEEAKLAAAYVQKRLAEAQVAKAVAPKEEAKISKVVEEANLETVPEKQVVASFVKPQDHLAPKTETKFKFDVDVIDAHENEYSGRLKELNAHHLGKTLESEKTELRSTAEQVSIKISQAMSEGVDKIRIKLQPAELGKIDVEMKMDDKGKTEIHILADRAETLDLLRKDSHDLERALRDSGIKTDLGGLQFSMRDQNKGEQFSGLVNNKPLNFKGYETQETERKIAFSFHKGGVNLVA